MELDLKSLSIGMNPGGVFVVDNSALSSFYGCTTAAWLRYLMGYTGPNEGAALKAGGAAHTAREQYYKTGSVQSALVTFDAAYKEWANQHVTGDDRLGWSNTRTIVQEYLQSLEPIGDGKFKGHVLAYPEPSTQIELAGLVPLDEAENLWFAYRLDGLGVYNSGYAIEEFKTTGMIHAMWKNKWKMSSQITGYLWAARQVYDVPILGAFVQGLEFSLLPGDPSRKCQKHNMKFSECRLMHAKWEPVGLLERSQGLIEGWYADALDGARKMRDILAKAPTLESAPVMAQEGAFNNSCQWCQFIGMCETGRQPHLIEANYQIDRWSPFADE